MASFTAITENERQVILAAIAHWNRHTCLKLTPFNQTTRQHHVYFRSDTKGCWSLVGRNPAFEEGQPISIGLGCAKVGTWSVAVKSIAGLNIETEEGP
jgi:hypothetical protein